MKQIKYRGSSGASYLLSYMRFLCAVTARLVASLPQGTVRRGLRAHHAGSAGAGGLIPKLFGARVVLNLHDMMPELYMSKFGISEKHPLIRFLAFQEQLSIRLADRAICGARSASRCALPARHAAVRRSLCCPTFPIRGCFATKAPAAPADGTFRIVYHGTIARRLGLDLAVSAFAKAAPSCPDARLEIFGDGDAGDELEAQIQASGVADKIAFSRKMFRVEDISAMIQGASVGIICNRRDLATEYMLPVKLLEYVQLGIPAIAPRLMTIEYYFDGTRLSITRPATWTHWPPPFALSMPTPKSVRN